MKAPVAPQLKVGVPGQTQTYDTALPYLHVDNPTNARIVFDNGMTVGPYTLNAVISLPSSTGSYQVDTSDVSYPNVGIFSNAPISTWLTDEERPQPGVSYAPIANITSTITVTGNVNATVTNTINATITNASIPVTQSGTWNVNISNATISVAQSGTWNVGITGTANVSITNATIAVTQSGSWSVTISNATINVSGTVNISLGPVDQTVSGNLNALNAIVGPLAIAGLQGISAAFDAGNLVGIIKGQISYDGGTNWIGGLQFVDTTGNAGGGLAFNAWTVSGAISFPYGFSVVVPAGASHVRIYVATYTSGSVTGRLRATTSQAPAIVFTGQPTVILGGGTANVGTIQAINSTVTVAGTINIGNTPSVTISGTPSVTIASGTVSISGTVGINIVTQSVNLNTQQPQTSLGNFTVAANGGSNNATYTLPTGTHAIGIAVTGDGIVKGLLTLQVTGVTTGINYINIVAVIPNGTALFGYFISPVLSVLDTQVKITGTTPGTFNNSVIVYSVAILDAEGVFVFDNFEEPVAMVMVDSLGNTIGNKQANPIFANPTLSEINGTGQQGVWTTTAIAPPSTSTYFNLISANSNRRGAIIYARGDVVGSIQIVFDTVNGQVQLPATGYWEMPSPVTTVLVKGFTNQSSTGGSINVVEIT